VICAEAGGVEEKDEKALADFRTAYQKKFGVDVKLYAPYVYDAVMMMADAMQKANSTEPARYLPELAKLKYKGVTGQIEFDAFGDIKNGTLTLYTYKAGKRDRIMVTK
jgi:branched-chain amino acid transport system substrate-binding protein